MTREEFDAIWTDEELKQMGLTREEMFKMHQEEEEYTNAWADRVRYTFE